MKKRIVSLFVGFVLCMCMFIPFMSGCSSCSENKAEVSLIGIHTSIQKDETENQPTRQSKAVRLGVRKEVGTKTHYGHHEPGWPWWDFRHDDCEDDIKYENPETGEYEDNDDPISGMTRGYTFIYKTQTELQFTIELNNPKNYYIFDFKLSCAEEDISYWDNVNEEWVAINDTWIRWNGSNNLKARYLLKLPNPEVSPDTIHISDMYYSNRVDQKNKIAVNMNNKETYCIYKMEEVMLDTETVKNSFDEYQFVINKRDGVEVRSVSIGGVELTADENGVYTSKIGGELVVKYEKPVSDDLNCVREYRRNIELMEFKVGYLKETNNPISSSLFFVTKYIGTDVEINTFTLEFVDGEQIELKLFTKNLTGFFDMEDNKIEAAYSNEKLQEMIDAGFIPKQIILGYGIIVSLN